MTGNNEQLAMMAFQEATKTSAQIGVLQQQLADLKKNDNARENVNKEQTDKISEMEVTIGKLAGSMDTFLKMMNKTDVTVTTGNVSGNVGIAESGGKVENG